MRGWKTKRQNTGNNYSERTLCLLKNQKLHISGLPRGDGGGGGWSRVTVAKVLPYGGEQMRGRRRRPESIYSKFRIHTTRLPRRDGVNNSLLSSSLPSRTRLSFRLPPSQPLALMWRRVPPPAATGITHSDEKKTISGATGSYGGATLLQRGAGLDTHSATLQRGLAYLHDELIH